MPALNWKDPPVADIRAYEPERQGSASKLPVRGGKNSGSRPDAIEIDDAGCRSAAQDGSSDEIATSPRAQPWQVPLVFF